jgi:hypothetical protein
MRAFSAVLAVVVVLATGCSGSDEPSAPPGQPQPSPSATKQPVVLGAVPPIPRSFDVAKYAANPCDFLDKADFDALGFAGRFTASPPKGADDPKRLCEVGGGSQGGLLQLTVWTDVQPLQAAYADTSGKYEFTNAVDLAGMPTVVKALSLQHPGACDVIVATGKQQGFTLAHWPSTRQGGTIGICGRLATVAEALLRKLGA